MSNYFRPHGLRNNGNTCYFNATLQNLYRTVLFRKNLENVNALWRQKNRIHLVNEANSSENGLLAKFLCNVKKLFCNVGNGELGKYFFLFLTSLTVYKAGSTGGFISTACWILEHLHFIRSGVHKLSSNLFDRSLYIDHGTNCSVMTFQQYSELLRMCPGSDQLTVISSVYPWFEVAVLALLIWFLKGKYRFFMNFFGEAFSRCGKRLNSCDKVVLCCSGLLLYFTGHLMALSQPIYKLEHSPENLFVVFVMASSACLLFYRLRIADGMLSLHQKCFYRPEEPVSVTLAKLFADINSESGSNNHNPQLVLEAVCRRSKRFYGFRQQDSHELLRHLLDAIREEERSLKLGSNLLTVVDKVFGGHFRTVYTCETCATPYCLYEAFLDISLPITLHEDTLNEISDVDINEIELVAVNRHKQQHSQAYEDTSDKHQDPKETVQTTSRRDSAYDNISNPEKTETVQIHDESSRANEEKKSEAVEKRGQPKQIHVEPQISHNNERKERETVASQKQPKQQNLVTHEEPSKEKEEMKSENLQNKKQPKPNIHIESSSENEEKNSEDVEKQVQPKQIHVEPQEQHSEENQATNNENADKEGQKNDYGTSQNPSKSQDATLDHGLEAAHVEVSTASLILSYEINTAHASSTRSLCIENNDKVNLQGADRPVLRIHEPTQSLQLSQTSQHYAEESYKEGSVHSQKAKDITLCLYIKKAQENLSEKQPQIVTRSNHSGPVVDNPATKKQRLEKNLCPDKAFGPDDVNEAYDKTHNHEPSRYTVTTDGVHEGSTRTDNLSQPVVFDQAINENSGCQSHDASGLNNEEIILVEPRNTDSKAERGACSVKMEDKESIHNAVLEADVTLRRKGKLPEGVTSNHYTRKVYNQVEDNLPVSQSGCKSSGIFSNKIARVCEKAGTGFLVENIHTESNDKSDNADDGKGEAEPFDNEEEKANWKEALPSENCDWKTADFGDTMMTIDKIFEGKPTEWEAVTNANSHDNSINASDGNGESEAFDNEKMSWKDVVLDDEMCTWKTADFGDTDMTYYKIIEDKQNELKTVIVTDDKMEFGTTEISVDFTGVDMAGDSVESTPSSTVANELKAQHELSDITAESVESGQEQYSHGQLTVARNEDKMEDCAEELRNVEPSGVQPLSSLERNPSGESGEPIDESNSDSGRPTEGVLVTTGMDTSHGVERAVDKRSHAFVREGQGTTSVKQNTEVPDTSTNESKNENQKTKKSKGKSKEKKVHEKEYDDNSMKARRPVGLQNLGNTCFFNAVLQNLNQSFLLYDLLAEKDFRRLSLTKSMVELYGQMQSKVSCTSPFDVLEKLCKRSPRFSGGRQQDSHELLRHLLDGLRIEEREVLGDPNNRKILTRVDTVFGGHFTTVYICKDCKMPYLVCEPMLDISLPIAYDNFDNDEESDVDGEEDETSEGDLSYRKAAESLMTPLALEDKQDAQGMGQKGSKGEYQLPSKNKKSRQKRRKNQSPSEHLPLKKSRGEGRSILDCLGAVTRTEHIADEYLCLACHSKRVDQGATDYQMTSAKKRTLIYNPPAILTLHLKRFEQTAHGFIKCNDKISFQDMIDIGPYCSSWCMRNEGNQTSIWYSLYGVVVHGGSLDGGHYVAYVKMRKPDDNIRQFLQKSYLDPQYLTQEKLVELMKKMQNLSKANREEKWKPQPMNGKWFYVSDSHISEVSEEDVWRQQAYLLFYERLPEENRPKKSAIYRRQTSNVETSV